MKQVLLGSILNKAAESRRTQEKFFEKYAPQIIEAAQVVANSLAEGSRIFVAGNGGSSCDSAHIAVEFNHPIFEELPAFEAVDLTANPALLTALLNDIGIEEIFVRQLAAQAKPKDIFIGISTSGNSTNLIKAFEWAKENNLITIALLGGNGGKIGSECETDFPFIVEADSDRNIHRVQEVHLPLYHILWDLVHVFLEEKTQLSSYALASN